jgi:hypothetical protein
MADPSDRPFPRRPAPARSAKSVARPSRGARNSPGPAERAVCPPSAPRPPTNSRPAGHASGPHLCAHARGTTGSPGERSAHIQSPARPRIHGRGEYFSPHPAPTYLRIHALIASVSTKSRVHIPTHPRIRTPADPRIRPCLPADPGCPGLPAPPGRAFRPSCATNPGAPARASRSGPPHPPNASGSPVAPPVRPPTPHVHLGPRHPPTPSPPRKNLPPHRTHGPYGVPASGPNPAGRRNSHPVRAFRLYRIPVRAREDRPRYPRFPGLSRSPAVSDRRYEAPGFADC